MQRDTSKPAIVLSLKSAGENNFNVTLLTPTDGIIYATLYGGPKSKLRSLVAQWHSGNIWLYHNPEKNQIKITDFEVLNYHASFSQNLFKMYAASLAAEIIIKTKCAGSNDQSYTLLSGFLDGMELCTEEQCRLGMIRFIWRYLGLLGIRPQTDSCSNCGKSFFETRFAPESISYYNNMSNVFLCPDCIKSNNDDSVSIQLSIAAVQYLTGISNLTPAQVRQLKIDKNTYLQLKNFVFFLIETNIEQKLKTIEIGVGIL